jgi:hypothetical protein
MYFHEVLKLDISSNGGDIKDWDYNALVFYRVLKAAVELQHDEHDLVGYIIDRMELVVDISQAYRIKEAIGPKTVPVTVLINN